MLFTVDIWNTATVSTHCCNRLRQCAYAACLVSPLLIVSIILVHPAMPLPKHDNAVNSGLSFCASACCHSTAGQLLNEYWCCCLLGDNNWSSAAASVPQHSYQICLVVLVHLRVTVALSPRDQLVVILISLFFLFLSLTLLSLLFLLPSALPSCRGCCCVAVATKMEDVDVCTSSQYHFLLASQILHPSIVERN